MSLDLEKLQATSAVIIIVGGNDGPGWGIQFVNGVPKIVPIPGWEEERLRGLVAAVRIAAESQKVQDRAIGHRIGTEAAHLVRSEVDGFLKAVGANEQGGLNGAILVAGG
jgi:hypothetical protein